MSFLQQDEYPEDEQNSAQTVRLRIPLVGLAVALSLLVGAVAGIVAYRYAAAKGKPPTAPPASITAQPAPVVTPPAPVAAQPAPITAAGAVMESPAVSNQPAVRRIDPQLVKGNLQVTIALDQLIPYDAHRLDHPDRVYVDLHGARLGPDLAVKTVFVNKGGVSSIRLGQTQPDTVRVVLDLEKRFDYSVAKQTNPAALVVKLTSHTPVRRKRRPASGPPKKGFRQ